jgi:outer membrane receptor protein involved in Fe transport
MALKSYALVSPIAAAVALALSTGANAQDPEDEITVTGTRIQRTSGFTTPVPVTSVSLDELKALKPGTTMVDQLDQLPQFFQTQSAQRGGGALFGTAGGSYLDLRAMGPQRNLILLDGARVTPADRNGTVTIDNFPTALLRSVEVVTGGASAAYGADALAGVTNFILDRNFTGLDFSLDAGQTDVSDGDNYQVSVAGGIELGERWHFIGSFEDQHIDQIMRDPAELGDWFRRWGPVQNPAWTPGNAAVPRYFILPDVHSTLHTPTGKIMRVNAAGAVLPFSLNGYTFTNSGTAVRPFAPGDIVGCGALPTCVASNPTGGTGSQSGGPEAAIANAAFEGGPYGAEVERNNLFTGFTFDANDDLQFFANLFGGVTESNNLDRRGIPHGTAPWNFTIFRENAFLPAAVRNTMFAEGITEFRFEKQGTVLGQPGSWNDHEERRNEFETWTLQLGVDHQFTDNWRLQARVQRGATDKYTAVLNELRVDREFLALDAVSVDANGNVLGDQPGEDPALGTIICNVQRYNPTPAQLRDAVDGNSSVTPPIPPVLVPSVQGDDSLGGPADLVPIPGPVGPDAIPNCVPLNAFGLGNASPAAQAYLTSPKWGDSAVTQEFAEVLFTGDIWDGFGPGAFSMAAGLTYRDQWFWQRGQPQDLMAYGPPRNADGSAASGFVNLGIRGFPAGFTGGSANLHEFSTVPAIKGGYDVWEAFAEFNMPLWESGPRRFELDVAGRYSDYSTSGGINSYKTGVNLTIMESLRFRATKSRDVREPTFSERYDLQGGGGRVNDPQNGNASVEITITSGGNPDLNPEEADTMTAGFVFQPTAAPGFQFSIDWYDIDLREAVGQLGATPQAAAQNIVNYCNNGVTELCPLILRDPTTGAITNVRSVFTNIDRANVRGIDYEIVYNTEPDLASNRSESLTLRLLAGRLLEDSVTSTSPTGPVTTDNANLYTEPDFEALATVQYQVGAFGTSIQQRYVADSVLNVSWLQWEPGIVLPNPNAITVSDNTVQSKSYTDLTLFWDAAMTSDARWRAALTITNLLDADPPVVADFGQRFSSQGAIGFAQSSYDFYGRRYLLSFDYRF